MALRWAARSTSGGAFRVFRGPNVPPVRARQRRSAGRPLAGRDRVEHHGADRPGQVLPGERWRRGVWNTRRWNTKCTKTREEHQIGLCRARSRAPRDAFRDFRVLSRFSCCGLSCLSWSKRPVRVRATTAFRWAPMAQGFGRSIQFHRRDAAIAERSRSTLSVFCVSQARG
jgi:hypothetical protein